jgi:hypothetical protein
MGPVDHHPVCSRFSLTHTLPTGFTVRLVAGTPFPIAGARAE